MLEPFGLELNALALLVATALAARAVKRRTLTRNGAIAGFCVGFLIVSTGPRGLLLIYFYQLGSWATKVRKSEKARLDATVVDHSVRGVVQVLAVSSVAVMLSLYHAATFGRERPIDFSSSSSAAADNNAERSSVACAVLAHHANSLGDTWASELGMLASSRKNRNTAGISSSMPRLITKPWVHVPPGTNGGVTLSGTSYSVLGGAIMGLLFALTDLLQNNLLVSAAVEGGEESGASAADAAAVATMVAQIATFGGACGFLGSLIDSVLGATVQASDYDKETRQIVDAKQIQHSKVKFEGYDVKRVCGRDWLSNEQVNFVSVVITTVFGGWILGPWWFAATAAT